MSCRTVSGDHKFESRFLQYGVCPTAQWNGWAAKNISSRRADPMPPDRHRLRSDEPHRHGVGSEGPSPITDGTQQTIAEHPTTPTSCTSVRPMAVSGNRSMAGRTGGRCSIARSRWASRDRWDRVDPNEADVIYVGTNGRSRQREETSAPPARQSSASACEESVSGEICGASAAATADLYLSSDRLLRRRTPTLHLAVPGLVLRHARIPGPPARRRPDGPPSASRSRPSGW
jgi:hypothetical protein